MQLFMPKICKSELYAITLQFELINFSADHEIMCVYKALQLSPQAESEQSDSQGSNARDNVNNLSLEQFHRFYEVYGINWELVSTCT